MKCRTCKKEVERYETVHFLDHTGWCSSACFVGEANAIAISHPAPKQHVNSADDPQQSSVTVNPEFLK